MRVEYMLNERLQRAIDAAKFDLDDVAMELQVDPRTVERWIKGRVPHPRYRKHLARLLHEDEHFIWPEHMDETTTVPDHTGEIVADYARRADVSPDIWWRMFSNAQHHIDLLGYAMVFLPEQLPGLATLLKEKSDAGCKIRIALANPMGKHVQMRDEEEYLAGTLAARIQTTLNHLRPVLHCPNIEIRFHIAPLYCSIFRFDNEMFVTPHLFGLHRSKASLLHIRGLKPDAHFAKYLANFEAIWRTTTSIERNGMVEQTESR